VDNSGGFHSSSQNASREDAPPPVVPRRRSSISELHLTWGVDLLRPVGCLHPIARARAAPSIRMNAAAAHLSTVSIDASQDATGHSNGEYFGGRRHGALD
jgi:hypothetical protein